MGVGEQSCGTKFFSSYVSKLQEQAVFFIWKLGNKNAHGALWMEALWPSGQKAQITESLIRHQKMILWLPKLVGAKFLFYFYFAFYLLDRKTKRRTRVKLVSTFALWKNAEIFKQQTELFLTGYWVVAKSFSLLNLFQHLKLFSY